LLAVAILELPAPTSVTSRCKPAGRIPYTGRRHGRPVVILLLCCSCLFQLLFYPADTIASLGELARRGKRLLDVLAGAGGLDAEAVDLRDCFRLQGLQAGEPVLQADDEPGWVGVGEVRGGQAYFGLRDSVDGERYLGLAEDPACRCGHVESAEVAQPGLDPRVAAAGKGCHFSMSGGALRGAHHPCGRTSIVSMPSMSGRALRRIRTGLPARVGESFYALDVGRGFARDAFPGCL
jgi:hypothetical protein